MSIIISNHARKQLAKRSINIDDVIEVVEKGEKIIEEINGRIGTKKYSVLRGTISDLVVIWFFNKNNQKEIVTAYWRKRRCI